MANVYDCFDVKNHALKTAGINNIRLGYRIIGNGEPLLLITGYGATMDMWAPALLKKLAENYRLIIFDNRGIAYSTADSTEFTINLFASDAARLLQHLNIPQTHVLGWSMGSYIAQELALNYPQLVSKLILYSSSTGSKDSIPPSSETIATLSDTSGSLQEREMRAFRTLFPAPWLEKNPDITEFFPIPEIAATPDIMERQLGALLGWQGDTLRLSQLSAATLLLTGTADEIVPPENSGILAKAISSAWLVNFNACGHGLMYQRPNQVAAVIDCFLKNS